MDIKKILKWILIGIIAIIIMVGGIIAIKSFLPKDETVDVYTVSFYNGDQEYQRIIRVKGTTLDRLPDGPEGDRGYEFNYWGNNDHIATVDDVITSDVKYDAIFKKQNCVIRYELNGGQILIEGEETPREEFVENFVYGDETKITELVPVREGYTFLEWKYNDISYRGGEVIPADSLSFTLIAQWSKDGEVEPITQPAENQPAENAQQTNTNETQSQQNPA